jgi:hypothetical protein
MNLSGTTTDDLLLELQKRGYYTDTLWQLEDVQNTLDLLNQEFETNIILNDEKKENILKETFNNDYIFETINDILDSTLRDNLF